MEEMLEVGCGGVPPSQAWDRQLTHHGAWLGACMVMAGCLHGPIRLLQLPNDLLQLPDLRHTHTHVRALLSPHQQGFALSAPVPAAYPCAYPMPCPAATRSRSLPCIVSRLRTVSSEILRLVA